MRTGSRVILGLQSRQVEAAVIRIWRRGEGEIRMSTSSGPKEYLGNAALSIFNSSPDASRVALMLLPGTIMLFLIEADGKWRDIFGLCPKITERATKGAL